MASKPLSKTLRTSLGDARVWRELEVRDGKVYGRSDPSGEPLKTTLATLKEMVHLGWMTKLPRGERYELTRVGMQVWIEQQSPTLKR